MAVVAMVLMLHVSTLWRYMQRARLGQPLVRRRGPEARVVANEVVAHDVYEHLEQTRGRAGVVVLSHVSGGSRSVVAALKRQYLTERESERKRSCLRVRIAGPGLVRSFDQLCIKLDDGIRRYLLICADAFCAFRTTVALVDHYDAATVVKVIASDIRRWGAPLVWRYDQASCHLTEDVLGLLIGSGVLPLCGPAHYPCYYGQMERMNLEHREWIDLGPSLTYGNIGNELLQMCTVLNEVQLRRILEYRTAAEVWEGRVSPQIDRRELYNDVIETAAIRYEQSGGQGKKAERDAWRYGVETQVMKRGLITVEAGARC